MIISTCSLQVQLFNEISASQVEEAWKLVVNLRIRRNFGLRIFPVLHLLVHIHGQMPRIVVNQTNEGAHEVIKGLISLTQSPPCRKCPLPNRWRKHFSNESHTQFESPTHCLLMTSLASNDTYIVVQISVVQLYKWIYGNFADVNAPGETNALYLIKRWLDSPNDLITSPER